MNEPVRCPCCGQLVTQKYGDKLFINSFMSNDLKGMLLAQRIKHLFLMESYRRRFEK